MNRIFADTNVLFPFSVMDLLVAECHDRPLAPTRLLTPDWNVRTIVRTQDRWHMIVKDKRREVRVSANDDDLLVEAAGIAGVTVSEFVLGRALSEAEALVQAHRTITLGTSAYEKFLEALDSPPQPIEALADQIRRSRRLKRFD